MKEMFSRYHRLQYHFLKELPFFGEILLALKFGLADCGTCFTDMKHIVFDPNFMEKLNDEEVEMLIFHEVMHVVLNHCGRAKGKFMPLYNIACDIVVNSYVVHTYYRYDILGEPLMHTYKGKEGATYSAEEIYEDLLNEKGKMEIKMFGDHNHWLDESEHIDDINDSIFQAKQHHGAHLGERLRNVLNIDEDIYVDWRLVLREYLSNLLQEEDYSFQKRDVRFFESDFFMPSLVSQEEKKHLKKTLLAIDVSGSISDQEYASFIQQIQSLQTSLSFEGDIVFFNDTISEVYPLNSDISFDFSQVSGYGGTSYNDVFELAQTKKYGLVIMFTDGYCDFPPQPSFPIVWILTQSKDDIPYGKVIVLNDKKST